MAGEKQERKSSALARIEAARSVTTVGQLADEYLERMIDGRWKHPNIARSTAEEADGGASAGTGSREILDSYR